MVFLVGILLVAGFSLAASQQTLGIQPSSDETSLSKCDTIYKKVFEQSAPRENRNAGIIKLYEGPSVSTSSGGMDLMSCVAACCDSKNETCNVAFLYKQNCYHVSCKSNEACLPEKNTQTKAQLRMVLVRPVRDNSGNDISWIDLLKENKLQQFFSTNPETEAAPGMIPRGQGLYRLNDMVSNTLIIFCYH